MKRGKFTEEEVDFLLRNYSKMGIQYCADHLGRNYDAIKSKAYFLNIKVKKATKTVDELKISREISSKKYYESNKKTILSKLKNKTKNKAVKVTKTKEEIKERKRKESIKHYQKYKQEYKIKKKIIRDNMSDEEKLKQKEYSKEYRLKNWQEIYCKIKLKNKTDFMYRLKNSLRNIVKIALLNKGFKKSSKTIEILGCSFEEFKQHLESKFESWMTWDNRGNPKDGLIEPNKTWDIDHIIPLSTAKTEEEVIKLNHYSNLQPLCSFQNRFVKRNHQGTI